MKYWDDEWNYEERESETCENVVACIAILSTLFFACYGVYALVRDVFF